MKTTTQFVMFCSFLLGACSSNVGTGANDKAVSSAKNSTSTTAGAIGDPCNPGDEAHPNFSAYSENEINLETDGAPDCASGTCLANRFRGRISCPYGQPADPNDPSRADPAHQDCMTTGDHPVPVTVPVPPQLVDRRPEESVYCSCRCDGPAGQGPFCACPSGFECAKLVDAYGTEGGAQAAGSYCIKAGTGVDDPTTLSNGAVCDRTTQSCGTP